MISVITPTVRPELMPMLARCLRRQTHTDFEWLVCSPPKFKKDLEKVISIPFTYVEEPPKKEGDYYGLCKAMNALYKASKGELVVEIVDGLWFPPDTLEKLWNHYLANPKACVTTVGNQYEKEVDGKPENIVWKDPRMRSDFGSFYEVAPTEMELCIASLPKQAILDCGGIDEEYDKGAAVGEKEMCWRMDQLGYKFYIDQTIEYRAIQHPRLTKDWDEKYKISSALYIKHINEIKTGQRVRLSFV